MIKTSFCCLCYYCNIFSTKKQDIFAALNHCSFKNVKVVILGRDPYHGPGQAHGLSFSVPQGISPPPSLRNIFKELHSDKNLQFSTWYTFLESPNLALSNKV